MAIVEDFWNVVVQDRSEVREAASCPAYTAQSGYLISFLRHRPSIIITWEKREREKKLEAISVEGGRKQLSEIRQQ